MERNASAEDAVHKRASAVSDPGSSHNSARDAPPHAGRVSVTASPREDPARDAKGASADGSGAERMAAGSELGADSPRPGESEEEDESPDEEEVFVAIPVAIESLDIRAPSGTRRRVYSMPQSAEIAKEGEAGSTSTEARPKSGSIYGGVEVLPLNLSGSRRNSKAPSGSSRRPGESLVLHIGSGDPLLFTLGPASRFVDT